MRYKQECILSNKVRKRLHIVDVMQGIAMLWVIIGHHLFDFMPPIYDKIHYYIYSFHMPYFIFISSFLIAYSYKSQSYEVYVYKKLHKFFIPYVFVGVFITVLMALQNGINTLPINLLNLLLSPKESDATFLWYIYLLFFLYAIYPLCEEGVRRFKIYSELLLLLIGVFLYLNPCHTPILCLDYFSKYFLFYVLGIISAKHSVILKEHLHSVRIIGVSCFCLFILLSVLFFVKPTDLIYHLLCFAAIPGMYGLAYILSQITQIKKILENISKNCFHIYLVHMFFIQGIAIFLMKLYPHRIESIGFMCIYLLISSTISIVGSIWVFRIMDRIKLTQKTVQ